MKRRLVLTSYALAGVLIAPMQAFAVPITHDFTWIGVNDHSLVGTLRGADSNADGLIRNRDGEVLSLSFEAFRDGTSLGSGYADPFAASVDRFFNLNFDIGAWRFTQGTGLGPLGQQWNVKGPGIGFSQGGGGAVLLANGKNDFTSFTRYNDVPGSGFVDVPEPATFALLAAGFLGFFGVHRSVGRGRAGRRPTA